MQFDTGLRGSELPVDGRSLLVAVDVPSRDLRFKKFLGGNAAVETVTVE